MTSMCTWDDIDQIDQAAHERFRQLLIIDNINFFNDWTRVQPQVIVAEHHYMLSLYYMNNRKVEALLEEMEEILSRHQLQDAVYTLCLQIFILRVIYCQNRRISVTDAVKDGIAWVNAYIYLLWLIADSERMDVGLSGRYDGLLRPAKNYPLPITQDYVYDQLLLTDNNDLMIYLSDRAESSQVEPTIVVVYFLALKFITRSNIS